jgi:cation diffusion facilitator family transporter
MVAEGIHSVIDGANGWLLLVGERRSHRPPDESHPFGYGHETYFWSMVVAMLFFGVGGGVSVFQGIHRIQQPEPLTSAAWNYAVLAGAAAIDGASFFIGFRQFRRTTAGHGFWSAVHASKDPALFSVVLEDIADLIGIGIAFVAIVLAQRFNAPWIDGAGSIGIGLVLGAIAVILMRESKALLIGERARGDVIAAVHAAAAGEPAVLRIRQLLTLQLGPDDVLVAFGAEFDPGLTAAQVADAVDRLERVIVSSHPEVTHIFIEAEALRGHR